MIEYVIKKADEFHGVAYTVIENGIVPWSQKTRADYETGEYEILSDEAFNKKLETFFDQVCGKWQEITEERYNNILEVLPPLKWTRGGFYLSEAYTLDVYHFFQTYEGHYYEAMFRITTPREKILESLREYIKAQGGEGARSKE